MAIKKRNSSRKNKSKSRASRQSDSFMGLLARKGVLLSIIIFLAYISLETVQNKGWSILWSATTNEALALSYLSIVGGAIAHWIIMPVVRDYYRR